MPGVLALLPIDIVLIMDILFVSTWFPFPPDNGSRIRIRYLLRALAEEHQVHLAAFGPAADEAGFDTALRSCCARVNTIQRDQFRRDRRKAILGYLSRRPRDVVSTHSSEMAKLVQEALRRHQYDVIVASCAQVAPYVVAARGVPCILEEHNFMTAWMDEQYHAQRLPLRRAARWLTWQKCRHYERWLYPQFDACSMVSERDRQALLATVPAYRGLAEVIPNGVDLRWNRRGIAQPAPDTLVYNGALTYLANADAMWFFLTEVMPLIRAQRPKATFKITGSTDGVDLTRLPLGKHVTLTEYLDDVRPTVAGSWVCVVPLRVGGGTRLKILEAMALGTPVVSTSKGAEGLEVVSERDILIADNPGQFAAQTVRLLQDRTLRERLARAGRALVEAKYGWQQIGRRFCSLVQRVAGASRH